MLSPICILDNGHSPIAKSTFQTQGEKHYFSFFK
jgi:hypothetical protein